ncbi:MAG: ABC transporter permease [Lachnospiraceae bacterium]|nr:ABC transporter permease [Lachnospiraceae bacterium]
MKTNSLAKLRFEKFMYNRLAVAGFIMMMLIILACVLAPLFTPYDPSYIDVTIKELPPSSEHLLGTDRLGRDILARLLYGGRVSIWIGLSSAVGACLIGVVLGCISGYFGGKLDQVLLYISEIFMTFPRYLLVLICVGLVGQSMSNIIFIFIATGWSGTMRIVRGKIMSLKQESFVESCLANGVSGWSIMFRHLLPNTLGPVIVDMTLSVAGCILAEAGLSFLGMGVAADVPTWGNIINAAKRLDIIQNMPLLWISPGLAISLFVLSINFFGDGLRDVFDPAQ